jgi:subtilase family serine protease
VSLLFCSGDYKGVHLPASDPDVTAVGGTTLGIGAHGQRLFETGWSDGLVRRKDSSGPWRSEGVAFGSGGGLSAIYGQPTYQQGVVPRSMAITRAGELVRVVPDIAADADPETGMLTGEIVPLPHSRSTRYETSTSFGTSQSTPLVAGMIADAEQGQRARLGFLNPLLYSLAGSQAFNDVLPENPADPQIDRASYSTRGLGGRGTIPPYLDLFDSQNPRFTSQVTTTGYDTMTGLGSPNGAAFITALRSGR